MKRIALSLAMIALVGSVVIGATRAIFTDSGSVLGNTVATGTLDLAVNKGAGKPVNISNMYPGYTDTSWRIFDAFNQGTLEAEYYFRLENAVGSIPLYNAVQIYLKDGGFVGACDGPDIYSGPLSGITGSGSRILISDNNVHATEGDGSGTPPDNIRAGWTQRVCQKFSLPLGADNSLQGQSVTFDEWVDAESDND